MAATPKPKPTPAPTPAPTVATVPTLIVYPFTGTGDIKADTGVKAAQLFVSQITQAGGVVAILGSPAVARTNYPTDADKHHADYYLSGYMTSVGDAVALVEQLVGVHSSTIVYSNTAQIQSFNDATAQAQSIRVALLANENRFTAALDNQPSSAATPTPLPNNQVNIGGLFKHRTKAAPAPKSAPIQKPAKGVLVVRIGGSLAASELTGGTQSLYNALERHYNAKLTSAQMTDAQKNASAICGTQRDNTVATGDVKTESLKSGFFSRTQYAFALRVYTCFGAELGTTEGTGDSLDSAIRTAVESYAAAHPSNA